MKVIYQKVKSNGEIETKHLQWPEDSIVIQEDLERSMDSIDQESVLFLIQDMYSQQKEVKK